MKHQKLIDKWIKALEFANKNEKLKCQVNQIETTIELLKDDNYIPTSTDKIFPDYLMPEIRS
jgi:cell division protein FtsB